MKARILCLNARQISVPNLSVTYYSQGYSHNFVLGPVQVTDIMGCGMYFNQI